MNRRAFLNALGLGAAVVALSPLLDLAPIVAAPSAMILPTFEQGVTKELFFDINAFHHVLWQKDDLGQDKPSDGDIVAMAWGVAEEEM